MKVIDAQGHVATIAISVTETFIESVESRYDCSDVWFLLSHPFQCFSRPTPDGLVPVVLHHSLQALTRFDRP